MLGKSRRRGGQKGEASRNDNNSRGHINVITTTTNGKQGRAGMKANNGDNREVKRNMTGDVVVRE